jgi:hypothetical protein
MISLTIIEWIQKCKVYKNSSNMHVFVLTLLLLVLLITIPITGIRKPF